MMVLAATHLKCFANSSIITLQKLFISWDLIFHNDKATIFLGRGSSWFLFIFHIMWTEQDCISCKSANFTKYYSLAFKRKSDFLLPRNLSFLYGQCQCILYLGFWCFYFFNFMYVMGVLYSNPVPLILAPWFWNLLTAWLKLNWQVYSNFLKGN